MARIGSDSQALKLWVVLNRAYRSVEAHDRASVAAHDLTPAEFGALEALYSKGPLLLGDLQRKILVSSGGITYVVDRLTEKGWVERRPCESDRRASYAALTPAGEARMEAVLPDHDARLTRALSGLDAKEKREAIRLLRKLGRHAEELDVHP